MTSRGEGSAAVTLKMVSGINVSTDCDDGGKSVMRRKKKGEVCGAEDSTMAPLKELEQPVVHLPVVTEQVLYDTMPATEYV